LCEGQQSISPRKIDEYLVLDFQHKLSGSSHFNPTADSEAVAAMHANGIPILGIAGIAAPS
jgi:hypothetical protein